MKTGVHEGSDLSPNLFIMVMDVLAEDVRDGSLMELLFADDLALCRELLNEVMNKYGVWKKTQWKKKGLRVNVDKTKVSIWK